MKKKLAVLALAFSVLASTAGCPQESKPDKPKQICKPGTVRDDPKEKRRHWVCNENGTREKSVLEPPPLKK